MEPCSVLLMISSCRDLDNVVNNAEYGSWNRESFIKAAKTTAKAMGLSDERLNEIADAVDRDIKKKDTSETNIRQAIAPLLKK